MARGETPWYRPAASRCAASAARRSFTRSIRILPPTRSWRGKTSDNSPGRPGWACFPRLRRLRAIRNRRGLPEVEDRHMDQVKLAPDRRGQLERIGIVEAHRAVEFIDAVGHRVPRRQQRFEVGLAIRI